ncbi:glycogen synthase GlgA [Sesbania bispinosa]|nr:glycogen synthase GlgA [Sesbania bispinosa]
MNKYPQNHVSNPSPNQNNEHPKTKIINPNTLSLWNPSPNQYLCIHLRRNPFKPLNSVFTASRAVIDNLLDEEE